MFDLSTSTADWLGDLKQSGAFEDSDLDELGSHLKDEVEQLMDHGLSEKEAFWVATSRLGNREELPREYAKANSRAVWRHRFLWMAIGILAYLVLNCLIGLVSYGSTLVAVSSGIGWNSLVMVSLSVQVLLTCGALGCMYLILAKNRFQIASRCRRVRQSRTGSIMLYAIPVALLVFLTVLSELARAWTLMFIDTASYGQMSSAIWTGSVIFAFLFAISLVSISFVLSRPKKSEPRLSLEP